MKSTKVMMVTVGVAILAAVAAVIVAKARTSHVKDSYFDPDTDKLRLLPANLATVRPTHFPSGSAKMRHVRDSEDGPVTRTLGRNVSLQNVIAEAWDCNPARVVLPPEAPKGGFDFLITTHADAREHLQTSVRETLGYVVHRETRDTTVWILKVENPNLPGLTVSPGNETADTVVKDGKLYFKHQPVSALLNGLSAGLKQPVVDHTGLTDFYDFSVMWSPELADRMQKGAFALDGVQKVIAGWGLRLESGNESLEMCVAEKAR